MEDTQYSRNYVNSLGGVFNHEKIMFGTVCNSLLPVFTRQYYKKRNNKICYIDTKVKYFNCDFNRMVKRSSGGSIQMNEHYSYNYSHSWEYPNKEYKEELIKLYNN